MKIKKEVLLLELSEHGVVSLTNSFVQKIPLYVDHVSGMTGEFALETYQMLEGINLMHK